MLTITRFADILANIERTDRRVVCVWVHPTDLNALLRDPTIHFMEAPFTSDRLLFGARVLQDRNVIPGQVWLRTNLNEVTYYPVDPNALFLGVPIPIEKPVKPARQNCWQRLAARVRAPV